MSKKAKQHSAAPTNKTEKVAVFPLLVAAGACIGVPVEDATCVEQPPAGSNLALSPAGRAFSLPYARHLLFSSKSDDPPLSSSFLPKN